MSKSIGTLRASAAARIVTPAALLAALSATFAALCAAAAAAPDPPAAPVVAEPPAVVLRDDSGREVRLAHPAQRIVSLLPSLTETVCALGACGRLVATDCGSHQHRSQPSDPPGTQCDGPARTAAHHRVSCLYRPE